MKDTAQRTDERDGRSAELRSQLEADAATLRKAQKAVETERAVQKVSLSHHCMLRAPCSALSCCVVLLPCTGASAPAQKTWMVLFCGMSDGSSFRRQIVEEEVSGAGAGQGAGGA